MTVNSIRKRIDADPRLSRVLHGAVSALGGRGLAVIVNAVLLPYTLHYLGPLEFGVWVTISSSVLMLSVLDLGIANTLTNLIAEANAATDQEKAGQIYATAFWITSGVVVLLSFPLYAAWARADWASIFHLAEPTQITHAARSVLVAAMFALLSLPFTLVNKLLAGYQQIHLANYFAMANSLLSLIAIVGTVQMHGTIVQLMASYCSALLVGTLCLNLLIWFWQKTWLRPKLRSFRHGIVSRIFTQGFLFFLIQCTGIVVFGSDNLVITHYLGPAQVTPYSFAWKLASYAAFAQAITLPSLWPAFSDAYSAGQLDWVRSTYSLVTRNSLAAVGIASILIALVGQPIIRIWAGSDAVPGRGLLWLMALFNFIMAITTNQALLLNATGRIRVEAISAVLAAIANLGLSIALVQHIGVEGVILSSILSFLIFMIIPQHFETRRILRGTYLAPTPPPAKSERNQEVSPIG